MTPLSALKLAEILTESGLPDGVFNVIQGYGETGGALVDDSRVAKVSLTGSVPTGRKVYAAAAKGMKHVTMELGGKSPLLIFDDASLDDAVSAAINANFYSSGQICSNGTRVFVQKGILPEFLARLKERTQKAIIGDPLDEATNFGPMISQAQFNITLSYIQKGIDEGATLALGGKAHHKGGLYVEPTIFSDVTDDMSIAREEIFGPVMSVLPFDTEEEALRRANDTEFGLAAGVFTSDLTRAHRVVAAFEAGTCWINTYNLTPIEMPFGGTKASGVGRENAKAAIEHYSELKSVYVGMGPVEAAF
jgi:betaine-aldehyde dehydrogenase